MNIYRFQAKGATFDQYHGMVCDIEPKFCTLVYVGMGNNVMQLRFHFVLKKSFPIFFAREATFCEGGARNICPKCKQTIFTQTRSYLRDGAQNLIFSIRN